MPALIGEHPLIDDLRKLIHKTAASNATVLVTGESGTGKEVVARQIHARSGRAAFPFVAENCGTIPAGLLESVLFGHERGAFTGAATARSGLFRVADGGTLFLDEVSEMSGPVQGKLLRVLQERDVRPVGGTRSVRVDVRVIAATSRDLADAAGTVRRDLYYRLHVIPIELPPLRARRSDIPILARHFLDRPAIPAETRRMCINNEALALLERYDWPGNVRELENLIERLMVCADGDEIAVDDLPFAIRAGTGLIPDPVEWPLDGVDLLGESRALERGLIEQALQRTKGNMEAAARLLGLRRSTLIGKMRRASGLRDMADAVRTEHALGWLRGRSSVATRR